MIGNIKFNMAYCLKDITASFVVFLVALPLCMGVAIASGVPVHYGIVTGIVGGLVVGLFTGVPLQVSGPAAGLTVMVFDIVHRFGIESLIFLGLGIGIFQILMGLLKLGVYFQAINPWVIRGLLTGIGLLISLSQLSAMLGVENVKGPINQLLNAPAFFMDSMKKYSSTIFLFLGLMWLFLISYQKQAKKKGSFINKISQYLPGGLLLLIITPLAMRAFQLDLPRLDLPDNFFSLLELKNPLSGNYSKLLTLQFLFAVLGIAFVATAETLLSTTALVKLRPSAKANYNQEMVAQGFGNALCGLFGAIPMTGVIVRSSANVQSGAETRLSTFLHGLWLLLFVGFFSFLLEEIPLAALAIILIQVGVKLLDFDSLKKGLKDDKIGVGIFLVTTILIVTLDLLSGVVIGHLLSLAVAIRHKGKSEIFHEESEKKIVLKGHITFLIIPKIEKMIKKHRAMSFDLKHVKSIDLGAHEYVKLCQMRLKM
jgi:MFS superfamily sulfate permease-like transporter